MLIIYTFFFSIKHVVVFAGKRIFEDADVFLSVSLSSVLVNS